MNIRRLNILIALLGLVIPTLNAMAGRTYPSPVDESESRYRFRHLDDTNGNVSRSTRTTICGQAPQTALIL